MSRIAASKVWLFVLGCQQGWGASLLIPFVALGFIVSEWEVARAPVLVGFAGTAGLLLGVLMVV